MNMKVTVSTKAPPNPLRTVLGILAFVAVVVVGLYASTPGPKPWPTPTPTPTPVTSPAAARCSCSHG